MQGCLGPAVWAGVVRTGFGASPCSGWASAQLASAPAPFAFSHRSAIAAIPATAPSTATAPPAAAAIFHEIVFPTTKNEYTL